MMTLAKRWWAPSLRGVVAIIFGLIAAFAYPAITLPYMVTLFGTFALVDGLITLVSMARTSSLAATWWLQLLTGATGIAAGLMTFYFPILSVVTLLSFVAIYAGLVGISHFVAAVYERENRGTIPLGISGLLSLLFGVFMVFNPGIGALGAARLIGIYAVLNGLSLLAAGLTFRTAKEKVERAVRILLPHEPKRVEVIDEINRK